MSLVSNFSSNDYLNPLTHASALLITLFASSWCIVRGGVRGGPDWKTLEFILPDEGDRYGAGKFCYNLSDTFCLHGYWFNSQQSNRKEQQQDIDTWTDLVQNVWRSFNWFSFDSRSFGGCCNSQVHEYMSHGCNYGVSPKDYYKLVTDFTSPKQLNRIKARYNKTSGFNVISELGFGEGQLIKDGAKSGHVFILPPKLKMDDVRFQYDKVESVLTFDWFKETIVCKGQPWICENKNLL
ncbi:uncharacterized protein LOC142336590 [Convolutriloba macropyga]|uniref:uncharacterized protein LOC142336590 n=1 Tax=Convolutriloba macropyga TaxID=536237 RepID=UPI003F52617D